MSKIFSCFVVSFLLVGTLGCSSQPKNPEQKITMGMSKADVLEKLGNPNKTARVHGADRWTYETEKNGVTEKTEIFFNDGKVSYFGAPRPGDVQKLKSDKGFKDVTDSDSAATPPKN